MQEKLNLERQYAESLKKVIAEGVRSKNRTGIDTFAIQHQYFLIENVSQNFPILRGKKMYPKMALKELAWMMNGRTDVKWLEDRGVKYWKEWANAEGTIGKSYGHQFRSQGGTDPLQADILNTIINNPESRRIILNLWNHSEINEMSLPPCVYDYHFACVLDPNQSQAYNVDLHVKQRSADSFLGVPYDFMFVGWFLEIICYLASQFSVEYNFYARDIHYTCDDFHIYENHTDQVAQYLSNVKDNHGGVIDIPSKALLADIRPKSLDNYLSRIDVNGYKDFLVFGPDDVYGPIKAPIAV